MALLQMGDKVVQPHLATLLRIVRHLAVADLRNHLYRVGEVQIKNTERKDVLDNVFVVTCLKYFICWLQIYYGLRAKLTMARDQMSALARICAEGRSINISGDDQLMFL